MILLHPAQEQKQDSFMAMCTVLVLSEQLLSGKYFGETVFKSQAYKNL